MTAISDRTFEGDPEEGIEFEVQRSAYWYIVQVIGLSVVCNLLGFHFNEELFTRSFPLFSF